MTSDSREDYQKLVRLIKKHNRAYYQQNKPSIPDDEYDSLIRRLKKMESDHPEWITSDSPTQILGEEPDENFRTVPHKVPMLSIDNTYSDDEFLQFDQRVHKLHDPKYPLSYVAELKLDGISLALHYAKGRLIQALTRGDGQSGDDVTANARQISGIPENLKVSKGQIPDYLEIRGEVYIQRKDFADLNRDREESGSDVFANPRNAAAGTLKLLDSAEVKKRKLRFSAHGVGFVSDGTWFRSFDQLYKEYARMGLTLSSEYRKCANAADALKACHEQLQTRSELPFDVDGMVIKVNEVVHHRTLGFTAKSPRYMVAYKFPAERKSTKVLSVDYQVGRTGIVTPVANLTPVFISGSTVSRCTLHNFDEIKRLSLKIGDQVLLEKSGDIIPKIVMVLSDRRTGEEIAIRPPKKCPSCSSELIKTEGEVAIRCINRSCPSVLKAGLIHFASRKAMDIEGLGEQVASLLLDNNVIRSVADLYLLKIHDIVHLERMAVKSASNLIDGIQNSKKQGLARVIFALGIPHVGEKIALVLASKFKTMSALITAKEDDLLQIPDMGPIATRNILVFLSNPVNRRLIESLSEAGVLMESLAPSHESGGPLDGSSVVVTGTLQRFTRDEIHALIRRLGGSPTGSVSKKTALLIAGEEAGSKLSKARELNIKIISENEFLNQYDLEDK